MAASAPSAPSGGSGIGAGAWSRVRRFGALRLVLVLVAVLAFGYLVLEANGRFLEGTVWQVPLVLELLLLSIAWRTISARTVTTFFFIGFGPVFFGTVLAQAILGATPLHGWLQDLSGDFLLSGVGSLGLIASTIWAPITEEIGKVLPLLLMLRWGGSHLGTQGGPLDFALLAGATGAGMGFAEDLFQLGLPQWTTPESPLLGLGVGTAYLALVVNPLNVFDLPVVDLNLTYQGLVGILDPSVEELRSGAVWAGHGVLPLLIGLGLGFAVLARRRVGRIAYLLPVVLLLWATWDHFIANWYSGAQCGGADAPTLCGLAGLDLKGALLPIVAIAGWAAAMLVSRRAVAGYVAKDPALALPRARITGRAYRVLGLPWPLYFLRDLLRLPRLRARLSFGWESLARSSGEERSRLAETLAATRLEAVAAAARLRGEPLPELPAPARARIARVLRGG